MSKVVRVAIIVPSGTQILDYAGPVSVMDCVNRNTPEGMGYETRLVGLCGGTSRSNGTIRVEVDSTLDIFDFSTVSTVFVPGGEPGVWSAMKDERLLRVLNDLNDRGVRIISVCTGSFILAASGILEGRVCTTHWDRVELMREMFPSVKLTPERVFTRSENIWTSAGVSTGIDTTLALVKEDFGREISIRVAQDLVLYNIRSYSDPQKSRLMGYSLDDRNKLWSLLRRIYNEPSENYDLDTMSASVNMSRRSFQRHFFREFGETPAAIVRHARVDRALRLMDDKSLNLDQVARRAGFSSSDVMRRAIASTTDDSGPQFQTYCPQLG